MATALIQLDNGVSRACRAFSGPFTSSVLQVVVTSSPSSLAANDADQLFRQLMASMSRSGARQEPARCHGGFAPGANGCWATRHPGPVRRVLIWVSDAAGSSPPVGLQSRGHNPWSVVIPILPNGAPTSVLPSQLGTNVARWYQPGRIGYVVPEVLVVTGIHSDEFKVFISYRWDDCRAFAEQLFDGLMHEQFDVYLDRFRTGAGTNFVERIRSELMDKSCVILLDSKDVSRSPWVAQEYAFCRLYKLGVMAIDLPGGVQTFRRIGRRLNLGAAVSASSYTTHTKLSPANVTQAVDFVKQHYSAEISRRFRHQRRLVRSAAALAGVSMVERPDGLLEISGPQQNYLLATSAKPPTMNTFRLTHEAAMAASSSTKPVVVAPLFAQMHQMKHDVGWLARATQSKAVDERRLVKAMRRVAQGTL
jgi:hypothetical protein